MYRNVQCSLEIISVFSSFPTLTHQELFYRNQIKVEQICEVPSTKMLLYQGFCSHVHTLQLQSETEQDRKGIFGRFGRGIVAGSRVICKKSHLSQTQTVD